MAAKKTARKAGSDVGNPFTLLAKAFDKGHLDTCLELLTNIYVYLRRRTPPVSLRRSWRQELEFKSRFDRKKRRYGLPPSAIRDFTVKKMPRGCYHVRLYTNHLGRGKSDCWLDYSTEANAVGIDGFRSTIAKRGLQLIGFCANQPKE
ncbi:MAG: hypothetical protein WAP51_03005 [Candidatus Sungiibacteriota bacterium]